MADWMYDDDHAAALRVRKKFVELYDGKTLEDAVQGRTISVDAGECYCIEGEADFSMQPISRDVARKALLSSLRLLHGIGPEKEAKLRADGYACIEDLLDHSVWKHKARKLVDLVDSCDPDRIQQELWHWLPKSHPLNLYTTAFAGPEKLVSIDIETMGLFSRPIFLFGAAFVDGGKIRTRQFLARDIDEEPAAIQAFCDLIGSRPIMSYNGRSFDVPYVNQRRWYYDMQGEIDNVHFDMLHFARRRFRDECPDARLTTIEKHIFGESRNDDVPGAMVPEFYDHYLSTGNPGPLVPIVEHNRQDIVTLARLFSRLCEEECANVSHR
jgi:Predicted exonuclease